MAFVIDTIVYFDKCEFQLVAVRLMGFNKAIIDPLLTKHAGIKLKTKCFFMKYKAELHSKASIAAIGFKTQKALVCLFVSLVIKPKIHRVERIAKLGTLKQ